MPYLLETPRPEYPMPSIPGPDKLERARLREQVNSGGADDYIGRTVRFEAALDFAQEQAKFDTQLALELAKHCQRRRAPSDNLVSSLWPLSPSPPPPLSQGQEKYEEWNGFSDTGSTGSSQSVFTPIPNQPIPGTAALSIDALQFQVNEFAKDNGFGVVRHDGSGSQVRKT
ncbi:hypothetical protein HIM_09266 [Hirsutella minnesotensis 3608]|uniref:Uncharacterized protein n=1 Tax=Hirsutella minnesotensis 3608 TaxID=1043627 RepID=A0A0F7ZLQ0_9HYPO|nr:hypothetical protein HIM_09266 [Hirsutella minnesotensis 3608]